MQFSEAVHISKGKRWMRFALAGNKKYKFTKAQKSDEKRRTTSYFKKCHSRQRHQINKLIVCITMEGFRAVWL